MGESKKFERGEVELLRAKLYLSIHQHAEAEASLSKAEVIFRELEDYDDLGDVLMTRAQRNLCQGKTSNALKDIEEALVVSDGLVNESKYGSMRFYRGLAYLGLGKELDAHYDLDYYIKMTEKMGDSCGQVLGHFYHAMVFERNREPCMALAELEMAKDLMQEDCCSLKGRLTAFIAHLWLRRGEMNEVTSFLAEAVRLIDGDVEPSEPINLGIAFVVMAEVLATTSNWVESEEAFEQSIHALRASRYGLYLEALASCWYGETIIGLGRKVEGCIHLQRAKSIYEEMGNESQSIKINSTLAECGCLGEQNKC